MKKTKPTKNQEPEAGLERHNIYLHTEVWGDVKWMADRECRSYSQQINFILREFTDKYKEEIIEKAGRG